MSKEKTKSQLNKEKKKREKARAEKARRENQNDEEPIKLLVFGKSLDFGLLAVVIVLLTVGLIMLLSASAPYSLRTEGDSYFYFMKQLKFVIIGIVVMLIVSRVDYRILNSRLAWLAYIRRTSELMH
jgi:cell division protein FtsW